MSTGGFLFAYKVIRSVWVIRSRATALDGLCRACVRAGAIFFTVLGKSVSAAERYSN